VIEPQEAKTHFSVYFFVEIMYICCNHCSPLFEANERPRRKQRGIKNSGARIRQPYKQLRISPVLLDSDSWLLDTPKCMTDPEVLYMTMRSKLRGIEPRERLNDGVLVFPLDCLQLFVVGAPCPALGETREVKK